MFDSVPSVPPDPIFSLLGRYHADERADKIAQDVLLVSETEAIAVLPVTFEHVLRLGNPPGQFAP